MKIISHELVEFWYGTLKFNSIRTHSGFSILLNDMINQPTKEYKWFHKFIITYKEEIDFETFKKIVTKI